MEDGGWTCGFVKFIGRGGLLPEPKQQLGPSRHDLHLKTSQRKLPVLSSVVSLSSPTVLTMSTFGSPGGQQKIHKPVPSV